MNRLVFTLLFLLAEVCDAHPLGNTTVNRLARIQVGVDQVEIDYLADLAEIPTLVASQDADASEDAETSPEEWAAYARRWAERIGANLRLDVDGKRTTLVLVEVSHVVSDPSLPLPTLRLRARLVATYTPSAAQRTIHYEDANDPEQIGWKEVTLDARAGVQVTASSVSASDRSQALTVFDVPLGHEAPNLRRANAQFTLSPAPALAATKETVKANVETVAVPAKRNVPTRPDRGAIAPATPEPEPEPVATMASGAARAAKPAPAPTQVVSGWAQAGAFFRLGVHHIATGWDHLVFLLGLLLLSASLPNLIKIVTAFTIAHSVTLGLAASGLVRAPGEIIEPAIALSIAYVGVISFTASHARHGVWLAFGFGLIHGFGFAGALAQTMGESSAELLSLASFNLGIEAVQVGLILIALPILQLARAKPWAPMAWKIASAAVIAAGIGWFLSRTVAVYA